MSSPMPMGGPTSQWPQVDSQSSMMNSNTGSNEDGVSLRPMRLKVLYTFDDQNKTNCLARWPHVLQVQTVAMDETTSIGVIELKTCIEAIVQCSPELVARLGQDYTVYAYDFSEYDNPLVGQGMLSWALAAASSAPDAPAHQSTKLITGRVCKNILGLFANGVKETLEVKLRLVPVPTVLQSQYVDAMEKYRELSKAVPPGLDPKDWMNFVQSNPNFGQMSNKATPTPGPSQIQSQRDGTSMEVVNQLLSPSLQQQPLMSPLEDTNASQSSGETSQTGTTAAGNPKKPPRPSRAGVKRPRKPRAPKNGPIQGGNTSGYEEGTDGDDGPSHRKRAKITQTDWNSKAAMGDKSDSLRVAASTAGSLRLFRPIAMNPNMPGTGKHLQEVPRAPTPVPRAANQHMPRDRPAKTSLRQNSFSAPPVEALRHISPYPSMGNPEDQLRISIEAIQTSPERQDSPAVTPPGIGSSPPVMRTRPPSTMRSSPPCPSSPVLPQLPRTDSGFMSGSMEELFGEDEPLCLDEDHEVSPELPRHRAPPPPSQVFDSGFVIEEEMPGPMELLPTKMPKRPDPKPLSKRTQNRNASRANSRALSRATSVASEDGQVLPPLRRDEGFTPSQLSLPAHVPQIEQQPPAQLPQQTQSQRPSSRSASRPTSRSGAKQNQPAPVPPHQDQSTNVHATSVENPAPKKRPASRQLARTASLGALTLPEIPASDPVLPRSTLHRSQTWSEATHATPEGSVPAEVPNGPLPLSFYMSQFPDYVPGMDVNSSEYTRLAKKASIRQKLELAIANGEMPPFCNNCGVIETPTWRKSWVQERQGQPGYHEYSDAPGKVTCINILTRNAEGTPTSYQLIYKSLLPSDDKTDFKEYQLCNPCGIWLQKYKSQRPKEKWQAYQPTARTGGQRSRNRNQQSGFMTSDANFPPSDAYMPQSEANFPPPEIQLPRGNTASVFEAGSPVESTNYAERHPSEVSQAVSQRRRSNSSQPSRRMKAMTSENAPAALRRALQSSPGTWGTRRSPIDLDEDAQNDTQSPSTRRLIFPSPRKPGSPKVLGEMTANSVVQISSDILVSEKDIMDAIDKENQPPALEVDEEEEDAELLKLFEEEMARPSTPKQKTPVANPFKTPTRPTPNHRPITRSISRSHPALSPGQLLTFDQTPLKTPTRSVRRSPRFQGPQATLPQFSPFTTAMNSIMDETNNNNTSPSRNLEAEFARLADPSRNINMDFNITDFFSTDVPMPSSPPKGGFSLYEDPVVMQQINWDEFNSFNIPQARDDEDVQVKEEPRDSPERAESESGEPAA